MKPSHPIRGKMGKSQQRKKIFFGLVFFGGDFSTESTEGCNEGVSRCVPWNQRERERDGVFGFGSELGVSE